MKRSLILSGLAAAGLVAICFGPASAQVGEDLARQMRNFTDNFSKPLAEPYKGITANGALEPGLFPIHATGVSTAPIRRAAVAFLEGLTPEQRKRVQFPVDDIEWRKWANQDLYIRQGISFREMTDKQRELAFNLLRAGLSAKGFKQTRDTMRLNETLGELNGGNTERFGEWKYFMTVMGDPSDKEPWGWQFDGHHAAINYFILGDQVVMTPYFAGSEPVIAHAGKYKGTRVMQEHQDRGLALINALPEALQKVAILRADKPNQANLTEAFHDNVDLNYQGVRAADLPPALQKKLLELIALHVGSLTDGFARVKMAEVRKHFDRTTFAWMGQRAKDSVFYYRIQSPVILIEFDHQPNFALPNPYSSLPMGQRPANREHIHVVVRTPNGNDYGKDLLRQHYAEHPHPAS
jgi:hypothetical protein